MDKLKQSITHLEQALQFFAQDSDYEDVKFLALSKAFEVAVEYAWKELKRRVQDEGLDADSPKQAVRQAAKLELIKSAESWLEFIDTRNSGVHDYFGFPEEDYAALAKKFLKECQQTFDFTS